MKEQDAAPSLIKNECYWIKIEQWKDRDTRIKDKWSIAKWDGESFEELNEMYRIEEVIEIGEQIPSNAELTRLRSELQQEHDKARNQAIEAKTVMELLIPLAENGMIPELKHTHSYIIERAKEFLLKTKP